MMNMRQINFGPALRAVACATLVATALVATPLTANAVTIDFNDGVNGTAVGANYAGLGVVFSANTLWSDFVSPDEGLVGAGGLKISTSDFQPKITNPIVATFSTPVTDFSIYGLNVGSNGARIDAYDAAIGGALLDFDEAFGVDAGVDNHPLLVSSASPIRRIEIYQPATNEVEGLLFDNMSFTQVPEPTAAILGLIVATAIGAFFVRKR